MSTVKVDVLRDNEGDVCYVVGNKYYGTGANHSKSAADMAACGVLTEFAADDVLYLGLNDAEVIHTYEVEITE